MSLRLQADKQMNWFRRFMAGRYGSDQLNLFLDFVALGLIVAGWLVPGSRILSVLAWVPIVLLLFRSCSRNVEARRRENLRFLNIWYWIRQWFKGLGSRVRQRGKYRFFKCPGCGQQVRVPKGAGHIRITCPKCGTKFERDA